MSENIHPINAFLEPVQEIINHYSEIKGYPTEYFITAFLAASSTAIGRSVTLSTGNFTAVGIVWAAIVGKPGITKSEAQTDAFKPLKNIQFEWLKQWQSEKDEIDETRAQNPKNKAPAEYPAIKQMLLNDITPEALSQTLAQNPKGCGIVYDELAGFIGRFNRYNASADEQMYLSLFNGDTVLRTRVNSSGNAAIKNSFLTIVGTIQPSVLKQVMINKSDSGFFDRWLMCYPENVKKQYPNAFSLNPIVEATYAGILKSLSNIDYFESGYEFNYTPDSYAIVNEFQKKLIDIENETEHDAERSILAKMEIYLHRFALILNAIEFASTAKWNKEVSVTAASGAVILCNYFIEQAHKIRIISPIEALKDNWKLIYEALPEPGQAFITEHFLKIAKVNGVEKRRAAIFLKDNSESSESKLFHKIKHGTYTKNTF
jgi:hypothetical protein